MGSRASHLLLQSANGTEPGLDLVGLLHAFELAWVDQSAGQVRSAQVG
jgi:hypothetical protein